MNNLNVYSNLLSILCTNRDGPKFPRTFNGLCINLFHYAYALMGGVKYRTFLGSLICHPVVERGSPICTNAIRDLLSLI